MSSTARPISSRGAACSDRVGVRTKVRVRFGWWDRWAVGQVGGGTGFEQQARWLGEATVRLWSIWK